MMFNIDHSLRLFWIAYQRRVMTGRYLTVPRIPAGEVDEIFEGCKYAVSILLVVKISTMLYMLDHYPMATSRLEFTLPMSLTSSSPTTQWMPKPAYEARQFT
jgi:hypothetical protein